MQNLTFRPRPVLYLGAHDDGDVRHLWALLHRSIVCLSAAHSQTNSVLKKLPEGRTDDLERVEHLAP